MRASGTASSRRSSGLLLFVNVLVAYKGEREAARALHDGIPILQRAKIVRLSVADPRSEAEGEDPIGLGRLIRSLSRHGVPVEAPLMRLADGSPQEAMMNALGEFNSDLLVMEERMIELGRSRRWRTPAAYRRPGARRRASHMPKLAVVK